MLALLGGSPVHPAPGVQLSPRAPASTQTLLRTRRMLEKLTVSVSLLIGTVALLTWFGVPGWAAPWVLSCWWERSLECWCSTWWASSAASAPRCTASTPRLVA